MEILISALGALLPAVAQIAKVLFGMDKPEKTEVVDAETPVPADDDDKLLADFGLRSRSPGKD